MVLSKVEQDRLRLSLDVNTANIALEHERLIKNKLEPAQAEERWQKEHGTRSKENKKLDKLLKKYQKEKKDQEFTNNIEW